MKNIPVSNKLSKVIIAKDLTIQQRDQNKIKRELKNKNNKQSLQKTKASEMKTIQEEVDEWSFKIVKTQTKTTTLRALYYMHQQMTLTKV